MVNLDELKHRLDTQVNVRMHPAELEKVRAFAAERDCTVADVLRLGARIVIREAAAPQATPAAEL